MIQPTSLASYDRVRQTLAQTQADVLTVLEDAPAGMAGFEIADALGRHPYVVRPRLTELKALGLVRDSGQYKKNGIGRLEIVWELAASQGQQELDFNGSGVV